MEQLNCLEQIRFAENPPQILGYLARGEEHKDDLQEESDGSQPSDKIAADSEARNDFKSIQGNYIYRHHAEPRVTNSMCHKKNRSQYHCDYIDVLDVLLESRKR